MRIAVVASLAVHAVLVAWMAPRVQHRAPDRAAPAPPEVLTTVVLFDEPAPPPPTVARAVARGHGRRGAPAPTSTPAISAPRAPTVEPAPAAVEAAPHPPDLFPGPALIGALQPDGPIPDREAPTAPGDHHSELRPSSHGTYTTDLGGSHWRTRTATAHVARDGTVHFDNAPDFDIHVGLGIDGKFNADDWLMRRHGIDPYASAKLAYLDRTRDERARIGLANRAIDLSHAELDMQRNLAAARALRDPAARKQALFELWDDAAEPHDSDDAQAHAGAAARAYLIGAIRAMRPDLAFTPDELARLNARRTSRAVFAPYDE